MSGKWLRLFLMVYLSTTVLACAKTSDAPQDHANSLISEHNTLTADLDKRGIPSPTWSQKDLDTEQSELDRLEAVDKELMGMKASGGVVLGGYSDSKMSEDSEAITGLRAALALARTGREVADYASSLVSEPTTASK